MRTCPARTPSRLRPVSLLFPLLLAACSDLGPHSGGDDAIRFTNGGETTRLIIVVELETSTRWDPNLRINVTPADARTLRGLLGPGAAVLLTGADIGGGYTRGNGVRVFVYDVVDSTAVYRTSVPFTGAQLTAQHFNIDVAAASTALIANAARAVAGEPLLVAAGIRHVAVQHPANTARGVAVRYPTQGAGGQTAPRISLTAQA